MQLRHETLNDLTERVLAQRLVAALGGRHRGEGLGDALLGRARISAVLIGVYLVALTFRNGVLWRPVLMTVRRLGFSCTTRMYIQQGQFLSAHNLLYLRLRHGCVLSTCRLLPEGLWVEVGLYLPGFVGCRSSIVRMIVGHIRICSLLYIRLWAL